MTSTANVIYLPPGVVAAPSQPVVPQSNIPFDRAFFEQVLPQAVNAFCQQVGCGRPIVILLTVDGTTHYVNGISGVADQWVALHTAQQEHDHPMQVFVPYTTIFRVEIHPESDIKEHRLGFIPVSNSKVPAAAQAPAASTRRTRKKTT